MRMAMGGTLALLGYKLMFLIILLTLCGAPDISPTWQTFMAELESEPPVDVSQSLASGSGSENEDEDPPQLSAQALAALQEFYSEQNAAEKDINEIAENWVSLALY